MSRESDPGVPEALPRLLDLLNRRLGPTAIDRLWIFPPFSRGRRESGVVAVSCFDGEADRRRLWTARYTAEETGRGVEFEASLDEEGSAPPDRLPGMMRGVVRRSGDEMEALGDPREIEIGADPAAATALLDELAAEGRTLPPEAVPSDRESEP